MFHKLNKDCVLIYSETSRDRSTSLPGYRDVTGWKSTGARPCGWKSRGLDKPALGGGSGALRRQGRMKEQRDERMGDSQGKTDTDQGPVVSSRGVEEFGKNWHDNCYFLLRKMLFSNINPENEAKQNLLGSCASPEDKCSLEAKRWFCSCCRKVAFIDPSSRAECEVSNGHRARSHLLQEAAMTAM